jgi:purine-cytosine permease-like protein
MKIDTNPLPTDPNATTRTLSLPSLMLKRTRRYQSPVHVLVIGAVLAVFYLTRHIWYTLVTIMSIAGAFLSPAYAVSCLLLVVAGVTALPPSRAIVAMIRK